MGSRNDKFDVRDYFTFARGERIGIVVLIIVIVGLAAAIHFLPYVIPAKPAVDVHRFEKEIESFERVSDSLEKRKGKIAGDTSIRTKGYAARTKKDTHVVIEVNSADTALLQKLPGIGPVLATRIVKYRSELGGFYALQQLAEVYGMKPDVMHKITQQLRIDTTKIQKTDINLASFKRINSHPYISFLQTRYILQLRERGPISSFELLVEEKIFTWSEIKKLRPYIRFE
jgi:competence protein ComEA